MNWVTFNYAYVYVCGCATQHSSRFTEKGVKKTETFEHSVVLLLFLSTLDKTAFMKSHFSSSSLSRIYENIIHVSVLQFSAL